MTTQTKERARHTPTPWEVDNNNGAHGTCTIRHFRTSADGSFKAPFGEAIADLMGSSPEREANADFIVRAVNSHEAMVEALKTLVDIVAEIHPEADSLGGLDQARAALAATAEEPCNL